jgi:hypothetical protein
MVETGPVRTDGSGSPRLRRSPVRIPGWLAILLVSFAGLLLEVGYTRIVSYKLWYYYTYLVIGLSLLGIGSGGVIVALSGRVRRAATERIIAWSAAIGAVTIAVGYLVVARLHVNTIDIWDYGTGRSFSNLGRLLVICFAIFATFITFGVIVSVLLGRAGERLGRIYCADLVGAGAGCLLAIPLIVEFGPPRVVMIAALVFAVVAIAAAPWRSFLSFATALVVVVLVVPVVHQSSLPDVRPEAEKIPATGAQFSDWGPVFRVDVLDVGDPNSRLLAHDGTFGSGIHRFNGNPATLRGVYAHDPRAIPFAVLGTPPPHELIIGSAGGNEILASLSYHAPDIQAVELNPVTTGLLRTNKRWAAFTGHLPEQPAVHMHQGDGRSYLARSHTKFSFVWYVAPDSYAATNAASSGAFVLSESYLYTKQMIKTTLQHLRPDGIMAVQFGEVDFRSKPYRTSRYVVTARAALEELGISDPSQHILVAARLVPHYNLSTIVVSRSAIGPAAIARFEAAVGAVPDSHVIAAPGVAPSSSVVTALAEGTDPQVTSIVASYPKAIGAVSDDSPYFWHFSRFTDVIRHITQPLNVSDPENVIGERVLLLLLGIALLYAAVFLLLPFFAVRAKWRALPAKGTSAVYFAALGLGFMFFEITMIQRLVQFLGYPTYSLTITLAALLTTTGVGALLSRRFIHRSEATIRIAIACLAALTLFYELVLPGLLTGSLLSRGLFVRAAFAIVVLAPLGMCLGIFMPLGLGRVAELTVHGEEYVAWAWAVNGFFSVIGSVLTTILSMQFGFRAVQYAALVIYAIAAFAFHRLPRPVAPEISQPVRAVEPAVAV